MTSAVIPLILRRMRPPLLVLVGAYAIAIVGLTLMPGQDDQGNPWRMDFFHAFYVISYTAPTIGFGELPYPFSGAQRLWITASIYLTVLAWLYAVGTIISLIQDPAFRGVVQRARLRRAVARMSEPFYIVCGYGDTGSLLVRALTDRRRRVVVVDHHQTAIETLELRDLGVYVPGMQLDAETPANLVSAGLRHRWCAGVVAVTDSDRANLKIAITAKLENPSMTVIARASTREGADNMASFDTDTIVNAFDGFADRLMLAMSAPDMHRIQDWLTGVPATPLVERPLPPGGRWIICGFGRLGRAVHRELLRLGAGTVVVAADTTAAGCPPDAVQGKGTEAETLRRAGIDRADALIAALDDDADNLSVVMTARVLNPELYLIARENSLANKTLFREAGIDLPVEPSYIMASRILAVLNTPLLEEFLARARQESPAWHRDLVASIRAIAGDTIPETWMLRISANRAPAVSDALAQGLRVTLDGISRHPRDRERHLACVGLALVRGGEMQLLPPPDTPLASGDRVLFCGTRAALRLMGIPLHHGNNLRYMVTGERHPEGALWRLLGGRGGAPGAGTTPRR